jgi:thiol-disulfide isomerase/thioredoxin
VAIQSTPVVGCSTKWAYKIPTVAAENKQFDERPVTLNPISAAQIRTLRRNAGTGKFLLLNVWATWCGPCVDEFPALETMARMYGDRQASFVTLSINDPDLLDRKIPRCLPGIGRRKVGRRNFPRSGSLPLNLVKKSFL